MAMTLLQYCQMMANAKSAGLPTKEEFGKLMHDWTIPEDKRIDIAKRVTLAGGYACLAD